MGLLTLLAVVAVICCWKLSTRQYPYSPETRVNTTQAVYSLQGTDSSTAVPWSLETNVVLSDAVIRGKIVSDGTPVSKWGSVFAYEYDVDVTEVLYGELSSSKILLRCFTYMNLPHRNDDLVLFLRELSQGCVATNADTGMFAVMPDNTLYAFSSMGFTAAFDGKQLEDLYAAVDKIILHLLGTGDDYLASMHYAGLERKIFEKAASGTQPLQMSEAQLLDKTEENEGQEDNSKE